jgi:hypothetical protein
VQFFEDTIAASLANDLAVCAVIIDNLAAQRDRVRRRKALSCPIWAIENKRAPACHFFRAIRSSRNDTMMHYKPLTISESIYDPILVGSGQTSTSKNSIPFACLSFRAFMTLYIASVFVVIPIRVPTLFAF